MPPEEVEDLFRRRPFRGLNVTIPYKQAVIPLCDDIDPRAAHIQHPGQPGKRRQGHRGNAAIGVHAHRRSIDNDLPIPVAGQVLIVVLSMAGNHHDFRRAQHLQAGEPPHPREGF